MLQKTSYSFLLSIAENKKCQPKNEPARNPITMKKAKLGKYVYICANDVKKILYGYNKLTITQNKIQYNKLIVNNKKRRRGLTERKLGK
jgi:hypothetical protein